MDGGRSASRRVKDHLAQLLRTANSLLRPPCSSSTSTAFTATTTATTTISTSSSTATTAAKYTTGGALDRLRHSPPERMRSKKAQHKEASSCRRSSRRHLKNVDDKGGMRALWSNPYGFTTSDEEEEEEDTDGCGDDDTETFFSSRNLMSSNSSGFYTSHKQPPKNKSHHHRQQRRRQRGRPAASCMKKCGPSTVREPGFRPLVVTTTAAVEEEVRKGLAVVKRSRDPYGDFRESMVEMILRRQVFGAAELERLLRSYLSLNAPRLHPVILQAFSDIWVVLHGG
ncbi:transcription repressor OFP7-like [Phragmites australis]|uniref:transcription repressor OFP7-like n=1 Tax=Phragmites australis TaxID=29695 RepID=UPI002D772E11|nr:transcription repressor OFP7-like [Phragmites australis]